MNRFERQQILPELGIAGQQRLTNSTVVVIGAGGLGCPALSYLAAAGIGRIGIVDGDTVSSSNLNRQILYGPSHLGHNKAKVAQQLLSSQYPDIQFDCYPFYIDQSNIEEILLAYDVVLDGTDNIATRFLIADACYLLQRPLAYGAIYRYEGQLSFFDNRPGSLSYRDLYPLMPSTNEIPSCASVGVIGVLPGIIGCMQAAEIIKFVTGIGSVLTGSVLYYNLKDQSTRKLQLSAHPQAAQNRPNTLEELHLMNYNLNCETIEMNWDEAISHATSSISSLFVDIRMPGSEPEFILPHSHCHIYELRNILESNNEIDKLFVYCYHGISSRDVAAELREKLGNQRIYSLIGGAEELPNFQ